jgi:hypothetical protein
VSYTINIQGHKDGLGSDANASRDFEAKIEAKAREFVQSLEGVQIATFQGGNIGQRNLTEQNQASSSSSGSTPPASGEREFRGARGSETQGEAGTRSAEERQREGEPSPTEADAKRKDLR